MNGSGSTKFLGFALADITLVVVLIIAAMVLYHGPLDKGGEKISRDTVGVVAVMADGKTNQLVMVSAQGRVAVIPALVCLKQPDCKALVDKLATENKITFVSIDGGDDMPSPDQRPSNTNPRLPT